MNSKGFTYTLEALISGAIILSALGFYLSITPPETPDYNNPSSAALYTLLEEGSLRRDIFNENFGLIESKINSTLGQSYSFKFYVYNKTSLIFQSGGTIPTSKETYSSSIILSGNGTFNPRKVTLVVWYR